MIWTFKPNNLIIGRVKMKPYSLVTFDNIKVIEILKP